MFGVFQSYDRRLKVEPEIILRANTALKRAAARHFSTLRPLPLLAGEWAPPGVVRRD